MCVCVCVCVCVHISHLHVQYSEVGVAVGGDGIPQAACPAVGDEVAFEVQLLQLTAGKLRW